MLDQEIINKLNKFEYSTLWLDCGILTVELLIKQEHAFDYSDDQNTEHYRYQAFFTYLKNKKKLSDTELENYINLTFNDTDALMPRAAVIDIFYYIDLTDSQFQKVCNTTRQFGEWTDKIISREILFRQIKKSPLTHELFEECIEKGDKAIQNYLLEIADANQLQKLTTNGITKKIKNLAKEKLTTLTKQQGNKSNH